MKKAEYLTKDLWAFILFPCVILAGGVVLIALQELIPALVVFGMALLIGIAEFLGRKLIFAKILVDEKGIIIYFRNTIIKQIKWEEIKDALAIPTAQGAQIVFSSDEESLATQKARLENWKNLFFIRLNEELPSQSFYQFKGKILVPIRDFEKLPQRIKEKF